MTKQELYLKATLTTLDAAYAIHRKQSVKAFKLLLKAQRELEEASESTPEKGTR